MPVLWTSNILNSSILLLLRLPPAEVKWLVWGPLTSWLTQGNLLLNPCSNHQDILPSFEPPEVLFRKWKRYFFLSILSWHPCKGKQLYSRKRNSLKFRIMRHHAEPDNVPFSPKFTPAQCPRQAVGGTACKWLLCWPARPGRGLLSCRGSSEHFVFWRLRLFLVHQTVS